MSGSKLHEMKCEACRADAPQVSDEELADYMKKLPEWLPLSENGVLKLRRQFTFSNFVTAMTFSNNVADLAEAHGHHPEILTEWGSTTITWWTHKIKGLHSTDFIMAAKTDRIIRG